LYLASKRLSLPEVHFAHKALYSAVRSLPTRPCFSKSHPLFKSEKGKSDPSSKTTQIRKADPLKNNLL
jgi:hypothetical protein